MALSKHSAGNGAASGSAAHHVPAFPPAQLEAGASTSAAKAIDELRCHLACDAVYQIAPLAEAIRREVAVFAEFGLSYAAAVRIAQLCDVVVTALTDFDEPTEHMHREVHGVWPDQSENGAEVRQ